MNIDSSADTQGSGAPKSGHAEPRTAVLVGFPPGLEGALSDLLGSRRVTVRTAPSATKAIELLASLRADLVLASSRCPAEAVVELTEMLGQPRETRVIVLLAGHDPEAERRFRNAGLRYVLTMPVTAEELILAGLGTNLS